MCLTLGGVLLHVPCLAHGSEFISISLPQKVSVLVADGVHARLPKTSSLRGLSVVAEAAVT